MRGFVCAALSLGLIGAEIDWAAPPVATSTAVPTYLNQVNPSMDRESPIHDAVFKRMDALGANLVRYLHWSNSQAPFPELEEGKFNFTLTDQYIQDFMACKNAEDSVMNFDAAPAWMHEDNDVSKPLRDPSGVEIGEWISRIVGWYTKGGFVDKRTGKQYNSSFHYKWRNYEVLNEPNLKGYLKIGKDPAYVQYTRLYDGIASVLTRDHPELQLHGLSLAQDGTDFGVFEDSWFSYFFNASNHAPDARHPSYVTYHYYAFPGRDIGKTWAPETWPVDMKGAETLPVPEWPLHLFKQAARFIQRAAAVNDIVQSGTFGGTAVKISANEVGVIGGKLCPTKALFSTDTSYWNLKAALWGYYYGELARLGVAAIASSQVVLKYEATSSAMITGYPGAAYTIRGAPVRGNYPCVSMLDWHTGEHTAVSWALQMFIDVLGPGEKDVFLPRCPARRVPASLAAAAAPAAGAASSYWPLPTVVYSLGLSLRDKNGTKVVLLSNTNSTAANVTISGAAGGKLHVVDSKSGHGAVPYASSVVEGEQIELDGLAVALLELAP